MGDIDIAKELASSVRLFEDKQLGPFEDNFLNAKNVFLDSMLRHGILISEYVTPALEDRISKVCSSLSIPRSCVRAFVYNDQAVQADCLISSSESCVLRFTSGLVNLMNEQEFNFIAGHELGHFLLGHSNCSSSMQESSFENHIVYRARELSADRLGYLAIGNLEDSLRAIIKTASGLSENFLRFDISKFVDQVNMLSNPSAGESVNSTHPSMLIRCRALLWFSMQIHSVADVKKSNESTIRKIDVRVVKDLERFVDGQIRSRKVQLEGDIALWKVILLVYHSGSFTKDVQERIANHMGDENLKSILAFFELYTRDQLSEEIQRRLEASLLSVNKEFPLSSKEIEDSGYKTAYRIFEGE